MSSAFPSAYVLWWLYCKQYGPRSDCSCRSSLTWVHGVCFSHKFSLECTWVYAVGVISRHFLDNKLFVGGDLCLSGSIYRMLWANFFHERAYDHKGKIFSSFKWGNFSGNSPFRLSYSNIIICCPLLTHWEVEAGFWEVSYLSFDFDQVRRRLHGLRFSCFRSYFPFKYPPTCIK